MLHTLRRLLVAIITVLAPETELFHVYRQAADNPNHPWRTLRDRVQTQEHAQAETAPQQIKSSNNQTTAQDNRLETRTQ
jgi:hypothetical protein